MAAGRERAPSAAVLDSRTLRSTPEGGRRAGHGGAKRKKGSKPRLAVDTPGHLPAPHVTPATAGDRAEVGRLAEAVQAATGRDVEAASVDRGYAGERPEAAALARGTRLEVAKLPGAKRGFALPPRRRAVERSSARATRCRRLVKDYGRLHAALAGPRVVALARLMPRRAAEPGQIHNSL